MNQDKDHTIISIPTELARQAVHQRKRVNKYETNQEIKALDTWLVLKHETTSGYIMEWNKQKQWLCKICKVSETILRHRLKMLRSMELINFTRDGIQICSWEKLATRLDINVKERFTVNYYYDDKQRIQEWIIAAEIKDNQNRQDFKIITKLNKNPELKMSVIAAIIAAGADHNRIADLQYLLSWLRVVYRQDFIRVSEIHEVLIEVRPDNNRSVRGIANAWNAKHPMTVSYWKDIMQRKFIIDISKLQIESKERVRNKLCKVVWLKKTKQTLLCLCDQITLLTRPGSLQDKNFLPAA